jgi:RNA polymerase sigma factor (sigma-70 family)
LTPRGRPTPTSLVWQPVGDAELVVAAQRGDVHALAQLLARHESSMRAVALSILRSVPESADVVQDAALTALQRIGDLRDPHAAGPWLRAIVRNACRMHLRSRRAVPVPMFMPENEPLLASVDAMDPATLIERHELRDWVWHAIEELPLEQRLVVILRYFTDVTAYGQIAQLCDVPVGTVRSRLSKGRSRLHAALMRTAELPHDEVAAQHTARRDAEDLMAAAHHGSFRSELTTRWSPSVEITWPTGKRTRGLDYPAGAMDRDLSAGVRHRIAHVVASRDVVIWESDLISPPEDPLHCPPGVVWALFLDRGRVDRIRLFHPPRPDPV